MVRRIQLCIEENLEVDGFCMPEIVEKISEKDVEAIRHRIDNSKLECFSLKKNTKGTFSYEEGNASENKERVNKLSLVISIIGVMLTLFQLFVVS